MPAALCSAGWRRRGIREEARRKSPPRRLRHGPGSPPPLRRREGRKGGAVATVMGRRSAGAGGMKTSPGGLRCRRAAGHPAGKDGAVRRVGQGRAWEGCLCPVGNLGSAALGQQRFVPSGAAAGRLAERPEPSSPRHYGHRRSASQCERGSIGCRASSKLRVFLRELQILLGEMQVSCSSGAYPQASVLCKRPTSAWYFPGIGAYRGAPLVVLTRSWLRVLSLCCLVNLLK